MTALGPASADTKYDSIKISFDDPSWIQRAMAIEQIATHYTAGAQAPNEMRVAEDIFRLALYDSEVTVRRVLAESLKRAAFLPSDIVLALARDTIEVARPVLLASPVLSELDLIGIAASASPLHRQAILARDGLSTPVSKELTEANCRPAERRLAS
jgi:uncharacterized protein (DUF2336 family)